MDFGFINASEPWSGHYDAFPALHLNAHWHRFASPGWRILAPSDNFGAGSGSGMLPGRRGSYVTLVPPPQPPPSTAVETAAAARGKMNPSFVGGVVGEVGGGGGAFVRDEHGRAVRAFPVGTFTLVVETLLGGCGAGDCNNVVANWTEAQELTFQLQGGLGVSSSSSSAKVSSALCGLRGEPKRAALF